MKKQSRLIAAFSLMLACSSGYAQDSGETLLKGFVSPPNSAKPRVWWHWMNGNISKDGIAKDLLWMSRIGIGGFMNFDAAMMTPQIVSKRLSYMNPEWKDAFNFTAKLADSLRLEMAIAGSPGWSESGDPWVSAKDGMKKLVWNQIKIKGGQKFSGAIPNAIKTTGTFQNIPFFDALADASHAVTPPEYYQDIAVMAYKLPETDLTLTELKAKITSSAGNFNVTQLTDGNLGITNLLPATTNGENAWIQFAFDKP